MTFLILLTSLFISAKQAPVPESATVVLDVRTADEFNEEHARGAINVDVTADSFEKHMQTMDKSKKYAVYCKAGGRAGKAITKMKAMGFKNIENLATVDDAIKKYGSETPSEKAK